jgi:hypothetical protein
MKQMLTKKAWFVGLTLLAITASSYVIADGTAPEPGVIDMDWRVDMTHGTPQPIQVTLPGENSPTLFWYMTYTVTNNTGKDIMFAPVLSLYTSTGKTVRSGQGVSPVVFTKIKTLLNNPLLQNNATIAGKLLQGKDRAKDGVVIFRNFDPKATGFTIFFSGLSGETATVKLPRKIKVKEVDDKGNVVEVEKDTVLLTRCLQLDYRLNVAAQIRAKAKLKCVAKKWVMR